MGRLEDLIRAQDNRVHYLREADAQIRRQEARVSALKSDLVSQESALRDMMRQRVLLGVTHRLEQRGIDAERQRLAAIPRGHVGAPPSTKTPPMRLDEIRRSFGFGPYEPHPTDIPPRRRRP